MIIYDTRIGNVVDDGWQFMTDDFGNQDFYAPTLITIKDGFVYGFDDDLALKRGKDSHNRKLSQEELDLKREYLINIFEEYKSNE